MRYHVIIAAAGEGARFGGDTPKQYARLAGKTVLEHSVDFFLYLPSPPASVALAVHPSHAKGHASSLPREQVRVVSGSDTRKQSVYSALKQINDVKDEDIVIVHDAARPNPPREAFLDLLKTLQENDAATLALPVSDTLRRDQEIIDRSGLWALQTPQAFKFGILKKAHETIKGNFTDDTGLVSAMGVPVKIVPGSKANIKITTPEDLEMLEKLMAKNDIRTGMGFDVHAFSKDKDRKLILGGVEIPGAPGLDGHSDADAALHALTDALLGAIGENDIGHHFPPSNPKFKNMDSKIFLEEACKMVKAKGGNIQNADITIICEQPKVSPYREAMRNKIAEILKVDPARVNVKATTTEGLGFTGRGEGIAAQAVVTVKL